MPALMSVNSLIDRNNRRLIWLENAVLCGGFSIISLALGKSRGMDDPEILRNFSIFFLSVQTLMMIPSLICYYKRSTPSADTVDGVVEARIDTAYDGSRHFESSDVEDATRNDSVENRTYYSDRRWCFSNLFRPSTYAKLCWYTMLSNSSINLVLFSLQVMLYSISIKNNNINIDSVRYSTSGIILAVTILSGIIILCDKTVTPESQSLNP